MGFAKPIEQYLFGNLLTKMHVFMYLKDIIRGASQMEKVLNIEGMVCMNCVKHVEKALRELAGISEVTVSLAEKSARIQLNGDVSDAMLKEAVEDAGYQLISIQ